MKIFVNVGTFIRDSFFCPETVKRLESMAEVEYGPTHPLSGDALREKLQGVDILFTGWGQPTIYRADLGDVKLIAHTGGTVGGIIAEDVFEAGIPVLSGNQYYAESVAEGVVAYMLFALRNMGFYTSELKQGRWQETKTQGLLDKKVGIVSVGAISRLVIDHLSKFRCKIMAYSTRPNPEYAAKTGITYASLDEIFSECDIVSIHTARTPRTYHMIGKHHYDLLKDGALFINTSRGAVIDEEALVEALHEERFTALLDVYDQEPLPADHPLIGCKNAILFPHQCGPTYDRRDYVTNRLLDDVISFFKGEPMKNEIPLEVARYMTH